MINNFEYDVALSFAGEERDYVHAVANCLKNHGIKVFYDKHEEIDLWGKDLYEHLGDIYKNKAEYCVMFISENYATKLWTDHERRNAQERAFKEKGKEYILPARFDKTEIPGIRDTVGYVNLNSRTPEEFCEMILKKIKKVRKPEKLEIIENQQDFDIILPKVKRIFSDLEKQQSVTKSFDNLKRYFESGLNKLAKKYDFLKTDFGELSESKFVAKIYKYGNTVVVCKIWIGKSFSNGNSICYLESGREIDAQHDDSYNESIYVDDNGHEIYFKASMSMGLNPIGLNANKLDSSGVAKYLWAKFTKRLEY